MLRNLSDIQRGIIIGIILVITTLINYSFNTGVYVFSCLCLTIGFAVGFYYEFDNKILPYIFGSVLIGTIISRMIFIDEALITLIVVSLVFALIAIGFVYIFSRTMEYFVVRGIISTKTIIVYVISIIVLSAFSGGIITTMSFIIQPDVDIIRMFIKWAFGYLFGVIVFGTTLIHSYYYNEKIDFSIRQTILNIILIGTFIVVTSALFSNTFELFNYSNFAYILMLYYIIIAFFFNYKMILIINFLYMIIYQYFLIALIENPDFAFIQYSIIVYLLVLSLMASLVMMIINELKNNNTALKQSSIKLERLVYSTESLLKLSDDILGTDIKIQEDYLARIFKIACNIFDNYDFATCYIKEDPYVKFISAVGYDVDVLNSFKFRTDKTDYIDVDNPFHVGYEDKSVKTTLGDKYDEFINIYPKMSEAIRFGIYIDDNTIGGISFDISKNSGKKFNRSQFENLKSFQKLMNSFFSINYLNYKNISLKNDIVLSLIRTLELFDQYTGGHSEEVAYLSNEIAKLCGLDEKEAHDIYWAGVVHDIGKVGVDSSIINKPSKLTLEEYEEIKNHSIFGYEILNKSDDLKKIAILVKYHHEWWNGAGYPEGLKGDKIPLGSQIISICDAVSTMAKKRPYTIVKTSRQIIEELELYMGTQFSPIPTKAMIQFISEGHLDAFYKDR
ncbi:MAG: Cyclic di-GMP phosphodiesterase response regulator RpfG [Candidatus Izimaplasma bacterium HR2]|nr:MAG: Cyclic di-GMP phosphodiesterase response regulator RpfG [Candidatus Izimaplasma bacterium HR2]